MIDSLHKLLEPTKTIEKAMPRIIEAFISYYGEEKREFIEERFNNTIIIGYQNPENIQFTINDIKREYDNQLKEQFFKSIGLPNTLENSRILLYNDSFEDWPFAPLKKYERAYNYLRLSKKERLLEEKKAFIKGMQKYVSKLTMENFDTYKKDERFRHIYNVVCDTDMPYEDFFKKAMLEKEQNMLKNAFTLLHQFYPDLQLEEVEEKLQEKSFPNIDKYLKAYLKYTEQRKKLCEPLQKYEDYVKGCRDLKSKLNDKYYSILCDEFSYLFSNDELESEINTKKLFEAYFGSRIDDYLPISCFDKKSEALLQEKGWRKNSVMQDCIRFFNALGYNLGTEFEEYLNNPECNKKKPSYELIDKIAKRKKEICDQFLKEYYTSIGDYATNREKIETAGLLNSDDYNANNYVKNLTFVSPNAKKVNGELKEAPIMCICVDSDIDYLDARIIHELNHIYELDLIKQTDKSLSYVSGWDFILDVPLKGTNEEEDIFANREKREYELFSEITNELLAQSITKILHQNNGHIFSPIKTAKISGGTSYENTGFLIRPILEKYGPEVIESRKDNNINVILEKVGKDNFQKYNSLFAKFNSYFSGFGFLNVMTERKNGLQTERTQILDEIIKERNEILLSMELYANEHKALM